MSGARRGSSCTGCGTPRRRARRMVHSGKRMTAIMTMRSAAEGMRLERFRISRRGLRLAHRSTLPFPPPGPLAREPARATSLSLFMPTQLPAIRSNNPQKMISYSYICWIKVYGCQFLRVVWASRAEQGWRRGRREGHGGRREGRQAPRRAPSPTRPPRRHRRSPRARRARPA